MARGSRSIPREACMFGGRKIGRAVVESVSLVSPVLFYKVHRTGFISLVLSLWLQLTDLFRQLVYILSIDFCDIYQLVDGHVLVGLMFDLLLVWHHGP